MRTKMFACLICVCAFVFAVSCGRESTPADADSAPDVAVTDIQIPAGETASLPKSDPAQRVFAYSDGAIEEYIVMRTDLSGYWVTDSAYPIAWDIETICVNPDTADAERLPYRCGGGVLTVDGKSFTAVDTLPDALAAMLEP